MLAGIMQLAKMSHDNIAESLGEFIAKYTRGFDQGKERQNALILSARSYVPVQPEGASAGKNCADLLGIPQTWTSILRTGT